MGRFTGIGTVYIEPSRPWQTPFVESFNGKAFEAGVLYDDWCGVYNRLRPHSSLGYLLPGPRLSTRSPR